MYPFNRTTSVHVERNDDAEVVADIATDAKGSDADVADADDDADADEAEERRTEDDVVAVPLAVANGHRVTKMTSTEKTIFATILELSHVDDDWVTSLHQTRHNRRQTIFECTWRGVHCVSNSLRPLLLLFRMLAVFPTRLSKKSPRKARCRTIMNLNSLDGKIQKYVFFANCFVLAVLLNVYLININIWRFTNFEKTFGLMHAATVSCMITATKPVINTFVIIVSVLYIRCHERLLKTVDMVDVCFRSAFNVAPPLRRYKTGFFAILTAAIFLTFALEVVEFVVTGQEFGRNLLIDSAFITVPLLSLWNIIPLLYYHLYNHIVRFYCNLMVPITAEQVTNTRVRAKVTRSVYCHMCWAGIQVVAAVAHIVIICSTGMKTNETTRQIVNSVLRIVPDVNADLDRFQISCFVHKMTTQFMWGMTVWRAFPLERTTFFTLISVIVTYSLLLVKFKDNDLVRPLVISINGTIAP